MSANEQIAYVFNPQAVEDQKTDQQVQIEDQDELLYQELDPNYQPTQEQIEEYSIQILGMKLPEDNQYLYLAKQALKAPLGLDWQVYMTKQNQVYYKNKITQQKTSEHPCDIIYRKKYQQLKNHVEQEEDQKLQSQFDPNFQPTQQEIESYAIQILGMQLPEDEQFLYLAKQGLKAPIQDVWQIYSTKNEDIYYKNKLTNQKIFQHPADIEYRKKYINQKLSKINLVNANVNLVNVNAQ